VYKGTGDDYGSTVYIDTWKVQSDFEDIRFCKNIGTNQELDYWMIFKSASYADFWIEVPHVDRLNTLLPEDSERQSTTLLIYYGNSTVTDGSDGANTFREFDNLENYAVNTYLPFGDWVEEDVDEVVKITDTYSYDGSKSIYCYDDSTSGRNFFYWDITDLTSTTKSYRFHVAAYVTSYEDEHVKLMVLKNSDGDRLVNVRYSDGYVQTYDGSWNTITTVSSGWHTYEFCIPMNTQDMMDVRIDDTWYTNQETERNVVNIDIFQHSATGSSNRAEAYFDSYFVGDYIKPEPYIDAWYSEEQE
jgi:hypothetical protein